MIAGILLVDGLQGTVSGALTGMIKQIQFSIKIYLHIQFVVFLLTSFHEYDWGFGNDTKRIWQGLGLSNLILTSLFILSLILQIAHYHVP
ncbi:unnamed protein product [Paramecium pentaurelia]|uniref:Uncharacterized protein n=1 Tax=Paramecium pentaurelia TaxID=43138 RepID=A0A8S1TI00_9CILI|nr:unnamed protein product [Paramecium pentaurelia]